MTDNHGAASAAATVRIDAGNTAPVPVIDQPTASQVYAEIGRAHV